MPDDVTRAPAQSSERIELERTVGTPTDLNREHWDEATDIHARGNVYGIEDFKAGRCQLHRIEVEEVGDVAGKTLLHLQCHFGLGTVSWARRGAVVTGVDFSPKAIALARSLASEAKWAGFPNAQVITRGQGLSAIHVVRLGAYMSPQEARRAGEQAAQALGVTYEVVRSP